MQCDREISLLVAKEARTSRWAQTKMLWSEFVKQLETPVRGTETEAEYAALSKDKRDNLKDVGGFVGGEFTGGSRKKEGCTGRDLLTFDLDDIKASQFDVLLAKIEAQRFAYVVYSTRSHTATAPRIRLVILLDRAITPDEFQPVMRYVGNVIDPGMRSIDPHSFNIHQPMYWPSCCADAFFIYKVGDHPNCLSADGVLGMYADWRNAAEWPLVFREDSAKLERGNKQADPTEKSGIVGDFCRAFSVEEAIERFIPGIYEPCANGNRYTYVKGSSYAGAVVYGDGSWLYSNHATDPAGQKLCNAFDLVRLHLFGDLDYSVASGTPATKLPSYREMAQLVIDQPEFREQKAISIQSTIEQLHVDSEAPERTNSANHELTNNTLGELNAPASTNITPKRTINFKMTLDTNGDPERTINNAWALLESDEQLKGRIVKNVFSNRGVAIGPYPWDDTPGERVWSDNDDNGVRWYLERVYKFRGKDDVMAALSLCGTNHAIDPVKDYLDSLTWDGVERLDTLFVDYLGAVNSPYVRTVTRKAFVAAVARTYKPGAKFDNMTILTGPQGIGKSTLLDKMGRDWFSDSLQSFEGKDARELIQGTWINEIGELGYMNKQETNQIKQFLSQRVDIFRAAYGRHPEERPRRCVFFGTTNEDDFLKDMTGNRRFWPVDVGVTVPSKNLFAELDNEVNLIWAEAIVRYQAGEPLHLSKEMEALAVEQQNAHRQENTFEGMVIKYINSDVPVGWIKMSRTERLPHRSDIPAQDVQMEPRRYVCANEVWEYGLGRRLEHMKPTDTKSINSIIRAQKGWEPERYRDGVYDRVRGFEKRDLSWDTLCPDP